METPRRPSGTSTESRNVFGPNVDRAALRIWASDVQRRWPSEIKLVVPSRNSRATMTSSRSGVVYRESELECVRRLVRDRPEQGRSVLFKDDRLRIIKPRRRLRLVIGTGMMQPGKVAIAESIEHPNSRAHAIRRDACKWPRLPHRAGANRPVTAVAMTPVSVPSRPTGMPRCGASCAHTESSSGSSSSTSSPGGGASSSRSRWRKMVRGSTPRSRAVLVRLPLFSCSTWLMYSR